MVDHVYGRMTNPDRPGRKRPGADGKPDREHGAGAAPRCPPTPWPASLETLAAEPFKGKADLPKLAET